MNLLDDTTNRQSKFRTKHWQEINGKSRGDYNGDDDDNNNNDNNNDNNNKYNNYQI